jgi:hypothetical protein
VFHVSVDVGDELDLLVAGALRGSSACVKGWI